MEPRNGVWLAFLASLLTTSVAWTQDGFPQDRPKPADPARPLKQKDLNHREAERLYALGLLQERDSRLVEATRTFEQALKLDPESATLRRALAPLYIALDRSDDALRVCREALDIDPGDHETWQLLAHELKAQDRPREAAEALSRAAACVSLKEQPLLHVELLFELGVLREQLEDFTGAANALSETARLLAQTEVLIDHGAREDEIHTRAAEVYERLGRVSLKERRFDQAVTAFRNAQKAEPERGRRLSFNLAEVFVAQNRFADALTALDHYLASRPGSTEAYELKVNVLEKLNRGREVVPTLRQHLADDPENTALRLLVARHVGRAGLKSDAETMYLEMLAKSASPEVYRGLLTLYRDQGGVGGEKLLRILDENITAASGDKGQPGDATAAARARSILIVLRTDAGCVKAMLPAAQRRMQTGSPMHSETRRLLAALARRVHQLDAAEALYRSLLESRGVGRRNEYEIFGGLLTVLRQARKHEAIVEVCRQGLETAQNTNRILFHRDLALALMALGKTDEALQEAENAVANADADNVLPMRRTQIYLLGEAGQHEKAIETALALLKESKTSDEVRDAHYTLSSAYTAAKNYPKAEAHLRQILKDHPDDVGARNDLGYLLADQGKSLDEAETLVREALELDRKEKRSGTSTDVDAEEDNAAYVDSLGWVYFRQGKLEAARRELERAAAMFGGGDDPVVWDHLGDVYHRLGESAKAREAWQKALNLFDAGRRRQAEDRLRDIKAKLKTLSSDAADGRTERP